MWCTRHFPGPSGCTQISSPQFEGSWWLRVAPPLPDSRRARWEEGVPMRRRLLDPEPSSYEIPLRCSRHSRWRLGGTGTEGGGEEEGGGVRWSRERVGSVLNPRPVEGEKAAAPGQCKTRTCYRDTGQNSLYSKEADSRTSAAGCRRGNNRHGDGAHTSICLVFGIACSVHFGNHVPTPSGQPSWSSSPPWPRPEPPGRRRASCLERLSSQQTAACAAHSPIM